MQSLKCHVSFITVCTCSMYVTGPILETIGLHRKYLFGKFLATYWQLNFQLEIIGNLIVFEQAKGFQS